ncbi:hypothetical protein F3J20_22575 [Paraburkholderia sp. Cy-641]|uniref:hypothetical protein n=1 Tax=Paraburkholderia sp. Cy-641 TaxID=2608337 RepID=UPI001420FF29|nr:hypothetical protein [Paraburkholderia sp. Cy-641]NIF80143.1 hypothetical protein [Paraburkholderia sp. Cy-641]
MANKNVLVRVLQAVRIHATDYSCNDVVSMPARLAAAHEKSGSVDPDPDAVAYARTALGRAPIEHIVPEGAALLSADSQSPATDGDAAVSTQGATNGQADTQTDSGAAAGAAGESAKAQQ